MPTIPALLLRNMHCHGYLQDYFPASRSGTRQLPALTGLVAEGIGLRLKKPTLPAQAPLEVSQADSPLTKRL